MNINIFTVILVFVPRPQQMKIKGMKKEKMQGSESYVRCLCPLLSVFYVGSMLF